MSQAKLMYFSSSKVILQKLQLWPQILMHFCARPLRRGASSPFRETAVTVWWPPIARLYIFLVVTLPTNSRNQKSFMAWSFDLWSFLVLCLMSTTSGWVWSPAQEVNLLFVQRSLLELWKKFVFCPHTIHSLKINTTSGIAEVLILALFFQGPLRPNKPN